jgi:hypothetical protein
MGETGETDTIVGLKQYTVDLATANSEFESRPCSNTLQ